MVSPVLFGPSGVLQVADIPVMTADVTANAQRHPFDVSRVSNINLHCYGTFSTVNCTFEASLNSTNGTDGNWFPIQAVRSNANTIESTTGNLSAAPAYCWELSVNAYRWFRIRSTAFTSGTQNWVIQAGLFATEPVPAIATHAVTGTFWQSTQPVSGSVTNIPSTAQGASTFHHLISAASTNATSVKNAAGVINDIVISNTTAMVKYFKLYNKASAPTVGTDTPIRTVSIPANTTVAMGCGPFGLRLATGIAYALTAGPTVADTAAVGLNDLTVGISYT